MQPFSLQAWQFHVWSSPPPQPLCALQTKCWRAAAFHGSRVTLIVRSLKDAAWIKRTRTLGSAWHDWPAAAWSQFETMNTEKTRRGCIYYMCHNLTVHVCICCTFLPHASRNCALQSVEIFARDQRDLATQDHGQNAAMTNISRRVLINNCRNMSSN